MHCVLFIRGGSGAGVWGSGNSLHTLLFFCVCVCGGGGGLQKEGILKGTIFNYLTVSRTPHSLPEILDPPLIS